MKQLFVYKKYTFHRFNETTNEIEVSHTVTIPRVMEQAERKQYKKLHTAGIIFGVLSLLCVVSGLALIILASCVLPDWFCGVGLACILSIAFPLPFALQYSDDARRLKDEDLLKVGFEQKDAAYQKMEDETKAYAEAWRAAHPLEEKIRIAKQSGNCVDIAELVRYCGADLMDKLK